MGQLPHPAAWGAPPLTEEGMDIVLENKLLKTGPEWFILLIEDLSIENRAQLLFCFCIAWHLRNNATHDDGN